MSIIISKTAKVTLSNGATVLIVGESHDTPQKKTETAMLYTVIKIQDELGNTVHPDFSFAAMLDEEHLTKTVEYLKKEMDTNPEQFFPQLKKIKDETPKETKEEN